MSAHPHLMARILQIVISHIVFKSDICRLQIMTWCLNETHEQLIQHV
jgi:hypothetical protein